MRTFMKPAAILGIAGALALSAMTPSEARVRSLAAAGIGLAAGAVIAGTAAAANSAYYGPGYGAYAYDPGYAYEPGYTYEVAPVYSAPGYAYEDYSSGPIYYGGYHRDNNWNEQSRGRRLRGHDY
jgi:hypothetical protein